MRVELDAVDLRVARGDRLPQLGQAREGRVAVHRRGLLARGLGEGLDDVRRRRDVGIAAAEVDQRLAGLGRDSRDACEQRREVLLGERFDPVGARTHDPMLRGRADPPFGLLPESG